MPLSYFYRYFWNTIKQSSLSCLEDMPRSKRNPEALEVSRRLFAIMAFLTIPTFWQICSRDCKKKMTLLDFCTIRSHVVLLNAEGVWIYNLKTVIACFFFKFAKCSSLWFFPIFYRTRRYLDTYFFIRKISMPENKKSVFFNAIDDNFLLDWLFHN